MIASALYNRIKILVISIAFFTCTSLPAQQHMKFEHIDGENGLSQNTVISIFQDSRGFMWFGTRDGLNKYDGYKFKVYKNVAKDPTSISGNFIQTIYEDSKG